MAQTDVLEENLASYRQHLQEARESVDYWVDGPITEFVEAQSRDLPDLFS